MESIKEAVKEAINHIIFKTVGTLSLTRSIEYPKIIKYLNPKKNEIVLDVACGDGELSLKIADKGCKVHGIDLSEEGITRARNAARREKIKCEFKVANAENLPYPDGYFDKIVSNCALEHFYDDIKALKEMYRVLKLNGLIVLSVDSLSCTLSDELRQIHKKKFTITNYYTPDTLENKLEITGFKTEKIEYILNSRITGFFYNQIYIKSDLNITTNLISILALPICLISEKLVKVKDKGYEIMVKAEKV